MSLETATPVFRVADYPRAKAFWTEKLGFSCMEEAGEPVTGFGIFRRDRVRIFLVAWDGPEAAYSNWRAYFHVTDFDALTQELQAAEVLSAGPTLTEYGMREVEVTDPDGNVVCFGADP